MSSENLPYEISRHYRHLTQWIEVEIMEVDFIKLTAGGQIDMWVLEDETWRLL